MRSRRDAANPVENDRQPLFRSARRDRRETDERGCPAERERDQQAARVRQEADRDHCRRTRACEANDLAQAQPARDSPSLKRAESVRARLRFSPVS